MAQDDRSVGQGHAGDSEDNGGEERDNTQRSITSPATTKPRGAARVLIEITAVITIARSSSGVRAVRTAMSGPLMSGVQNTWCAWKRPRAFPAARSSRLRLEGRPLPRARSERQRAARSVLGRRAGRRRYGRSSTRPGLDRRVHGDGPEDPHRPGFQTLRGSSAGVARASASRARTRRAGTRLVPTGRVAGADRGIHRPCRQRSGGSAGDRGADPKRGRADRVRSRGRYRPSSDRYASAYTSLMRSTSAT